MILCIKKFKVLFHQCQVIIDVITRSVPQLSCVVSGNEIFHTKLFQTIEVCSLKSLGLLYACGGDHFLKLINYPFLIKHMVGGRRRSPS